MMNIGQHNISVKNSKYIVVILGNGVKNHSGGSCIFLHVSKGKPTAGCVAVDFETIDMIFQNISPNTTPILMVTDKSLLKGIPGLNFLTKFI